MKYETELNNLLEKCLLEAMDESSVDLNKDFILLGLDSISVFNFTTQLKEAIPSVPLTIFLECKNFKELKKYLWSNHETELQQYFESR